MILIKETQEKILSAFLSVAGIVERKHTLPILSNILLKKTSDVIQLTSSDLEIQIQRFATLGGDSGAFATTISIKKMIDILKTIPFDQVVSLESQQNRVLIKAGKSKFVLQTLSADDYPLVQESNQLDESFKVTQSLLKKMLSEVAFSMAVHDIRYYLNGILFVIEDKKLSLVATDGHRLAYISKEIDESFPKQEVILPRKTVNELMRLLNDTSDEVSIKFSSNQAKFNFSGIEFITKLVEGKFPDYNRVIPKNQKNSLIINRLSLLSSLQRAAILTSDKFKGIRFNFEPGILKISSVNSEQEEANDELDVDYSGDAIEIGFNVTYLIDVLNNIKEESVCIGLQDSNSSALITIPANDQFKYVVMPMRI
jgi:DNA polymerase III subunit beta